MLFDRAVAWLLANKVVLPGLTVLERAVARVRSRANERLWQRLTGRVTPEQRQRLESLVAVPDSGGAALSIAAGWPGAAKPGGARRAPSIG